MNFEPLRHHFSPWKNGELLAAFSGGADSMLALLAACYFQKEFNYKLTAIHINHQLRGVESDQEAIAAGNFAEKNNVEFKQFNLDLSPGRNLEARARQGRLDIWRRLTSDRPLCAVITGHHSDDCAENLFLRLVRGGNVSSLTGLRAVSTVDNVKFIRPLIEFTREEIERSLRSLGITSWACDSSNQHNKYRRNWLRNQGLPEIYREFPGSRAGIKAALSALTMDARFIESCAQDYFKCGNPENLSFWKNLPPALWPRVLRQYRYSQTGRDLVTSPETLSRLQKAVQTISSEPRFIPLDNDSELVLQGEHVRFSLPLPPPVKWCWKQEEVIWGNFRFYARYSNEIPEDLYTALFSAEDLPEELTISAPQPGDKIIPFGRSFPVKIKKLRIDRHLPAIPPMPLIRHEGTIYWAPGIRHSNLATFNSGKTPILLTCRQLQN